MSAALCVNVNASTQSFRGVSFSGCRGDRESEMELDILTEVGQVLDTLEGEGRKAGHAGIIPWPETGDRWWVGQKVS